MFFHIFIEKFKQMQSFKSKITHTYWLNAQMNDSIKTGVIMEITRWGYINCVASDSKLCTWIGALKCCGRLS